MGGRKREPRITTANGLTAGEIVAFWFRITPPKDSADCWEWRGNRNQGYGRLRVDGHSRLAHRISWAIAHGPPPADLSVCHRCDNRRCVNPDHLFLGTRQDNNRDKVEKGRQVRGEASGTARLTEAQVITLRRALAIGESVERLAEKFGVTSATAQHAARGRSWKHLNEAHAHG